VPIPPNPTGAAGPAAPTGDDSRPGAAGFVPRGRVGVHTCRGRGNLSVVLAEPLVKTPPRGLTRWPEADARLTYMYARYGVLSLFLSRFLPAIRALVPVFAGAARLPFLPVMTIIAIASGLWYGFLAFIAYRASEDWDTLRVMIGQYNRVISAVAVLTAAGLLGLWWWRRAHAARRVEAHRGQWERHGESE
jgi:hypothetical protein